MTIKIINKNMILMVKIHKKKEGEKMKMKMKMDSRRQKRKGKIKNQIWLKLMTKKVKRMKIN